MRAAPWQERGGSEREHVEERVSSAVKKGGKGFEGGEEEQAKITSLGEGESISE